MCTFQKPSKISRVSCFRSTVVIGSTLEVNLLARNSSPWCKSIVASRAAMRPAGNARRPRISGIFEGGVTEPDGMQRRSNADGLAPRADRDSDTGIPLIAIVLPRTAIPSSNVVKVIDDLDASQELRHLVPKLSFDPDAQGGPVRKRQRSPIHLMGENGLRMKGVDQVDALVEASGAIRVPWKFVRTVKDDEPGLGAKTHAVEHRR